MSKFKLGQRVLATGSAEHDTGEVVNEPGTIVPFDYGMKFKYVYRVRLDGRGFSALFTEDELTPLGDVTEVFKGDKVKHTIIAVSREDTTTERIQADGWDFDVVSEEFEVLERAYPHGNPEDDPVGTVRELSADRYAPAHSVVKVRPDGWVDLGERSPGDLWPDRHQVDAPIIGTVPGSPAAKVAGVQEGVNRLLENAEAAKAGAWRAEKPDPYNYYRDLDGDVWRHRPGSKESLAVWYSGAECWDKSLLEFEDANTIWHLEPLDRSALTKKQRGVGSDFDALKAWVEKPETRVGEQGLLDSVNELETQEAEPRARSWGDVKESALANANWRIGELEAENARLDRRRELAEIDRRAAEQELDMVRAEALEWHRRWKRAEERIEELDEANRHVGDLKARIRALEGKPNHQNLRDADGDLWVWAKVSAGLEGYFLIDRARVPCSRDYVESEHGPVTEEACGR